jgi:hypothetical protein
MEGVVLVTQVFNLATGKERTYSCAPFTALVCCYAQFERKDWNTWDYAKYFMMVDYTRHTYLLGDWSVLHVQ